MTLFLKINWNRSHVVRHLKIYKIEKLNMQSNFTYSTSPGILWVGDTEELTLEVDDVVLQTPYLLKVELYLLSLSLFLNYQSTKETSQRLQEIKTSVSVKLSVTQTHPTYSPLSSSKLRCLLSL